MPDDCCNKGVTKKVYMKSELNGLYTITPKAVFAKVELHCVGAIVPCQLYNMLRETNQVFLNLLTAPQAITTKTSLF